jgi:hypothetical protein
MIAHASMPAEDCAHVAHVLAEMLEGGALRFPPGSPDADNCWSRNNDFQIVITPRGQLMIEGPKEQVWVSRPPPAGENAPTRATSPWPPSELRRDPRAGPGRRLACPRVQPRWRPRPGRGLRRERLPRRGARSAADGRLSRSDDGRELATHVFARARSPGAELISVGQSPG